MIKCKEWNVFIHTYTDETGGSLYPVKLVNQKYIYVIFEVNLRGVRSIMVGTRDWASKWEDIIILPQLDITQHTHINWNITMSSIHMHDVYMLKKSLKTYFILILHLTFLFNVEALP